MKRLVIDTETTGLSPNIHSILTVGMLFVDVEKDFMEILDSNHLFIKQENSVVSPMALKINRINISEHNKIAFPEKVACKKINDFLERNNLRRTVLLGHNISFDKSFLNSFFCKNRTESLFHNEAIDTMHLWNKLKRNGVVPSDLDSKLGTLANYFKIDYEKAHDALADCQITAKVYQNILGHY